MSTKAAFIASLIYQIQQTYKQQQLTEKNQIQLNKTINDMYLLSILYTKCSDLNRQIIDTEMLKFQKQVKQVTTNRGGFLNWMGWGETQVINLNDVWPQICKINQPGCQLFLKDIYHIKIVNK